MFKNGLVADIYYTRFIASWINVGGQLRYKNDVDTFIEWLRSIKVPEDDISNIRVLATNGKLELENSAESFLKNH